MPSKVCHPLRRVVLVVLEANQIGATNSSPHPKKRHKNGRIQFGDKKLFTTDDGNDLRPENYEHLKKKNSETIEIQLLLRVWNLAGCQVPHLLWLSVQPYQPGAKKR